MKTSWANAELDAVEFFWGYVIDVEGSLFAFVCGTQCLRRGGGHNMGGTQCLWRGGGRKVGGTAALRVGA